MGDSKNSGNKLENAGKKMQNAGEKMQGCGCLLTLVITVPLILSIWLGTAGMVIGGIVALLAIAAYFAKGKEKKN